MLANKAACIGIILLKDIDPFGNVLANASVFPSLEVEVCTWWSITLARNNPLGNITINNSSYELLAEAASSSDNLTHWPTYCFASNTNFLSIVNLDILEFVHYIHQHYCNLTSYYVMGVHFGFRIYTGSGSLAYASEPQLSPSYTVAFPLFSLSGGSDTLISCPFGSFDSNLSLCISSEALSSASSLLTNLLSFPNIGLLLSISPFIVVFDEMSYYAYHTTQYNRGFKFFAERCWELNNGKWVPPVLEGTYQSMSKMLEVIQIEDWAQVTPIRFSSKSETLYFLNNAQDFLFVSAPLTVISFSCAWFFRRKVTCWNIPTILAPFTTFSYLFYSLLGDNIQYLSFRCFQQLRFLVPRATIEAVSIVLAIIVLFGVIFCAFALYFLIWSLDRAAFRIEEMKYSIKSYVLLTLILASRALTGFVHSYLDHKQYQIVGLLTISLLVLMASASSFQQLKTKRGRAASLLSLIVRSLTTAVLTINAQLTDPSTEGAFSNLSAIFIYCLLSLVTLQYFLTPFSKGCMEVIEFIRKQCKRRRHAIKKVCRNPLHNGKLNKGQNLQPPKSPLKVNIKEKIRLQVLKRCIREE